MCIFCKIAGKEIPAEVEYEDDEVIAFTDIHPIAPVHVIVIPKRHIASINDVSDEDTLLMGKVILAASKVAKRLKIAEDGYKLLYRVGDSGGQEIAHMHLHVIGGAPLFEDIHPMSVGGENA